jgi:hypothetical protein
MLVWLLIAGGASGNDVPTSAIRALAPETTYVGQEFVVRIALETDDPDVPVGSYGALLEWDPLLCAYVSDEGGSGESGLSRPTVNRDGVTDGWLRFSAADPQGESGSIELLRVTFQALNWPNEICLFSPSLGSLYEALTFRDLLPGNRAEDAPVTLQDPRHSLRLRKSPFGTEVSWVAVPGTGTYDVVRGEMEEIHLSVMEPTVELGPLVCIENDSGNTTTEGGFEDPELPLTGRAFFYLFRVSGEGYGESFDGLPRVPGEGDCPEP